MRVNFIIFKWSLLIGAIYFFLVSIVHMFGFKIPVLFIYFDVPSYTYQDKIISFLCFGWSIFLFTAFINPLKNIDLVKATLIAGSGAIVGLCIINLRTDFSELSQNISVSRFWVETVGLSIYLIWLILFYLRSKKEITTKRR